MNFTNLVCASEDLSLFADSCSDIIGTEPGEGDLASPIVVWFVESQVVVVF